MDAATITAISVAAVAILTAVSVVVSNVRTLIQELRHNTNATNSSTNAIAASKAPGVTGTVIPLRDTPTS